MRNHTKRGQVHVSVYNSDFLIHGPSTRAGKHNRQTEYGKQKVDEGRRYKTTTRTKTTEHTQNKARHQSAWFRSNSDNSNDKIAILIVNYNLIRCVALRCVAQIINSSGGNDTLRNATDQKMHMVIKY